MFRALKNERERKKKIRALDEYINKAVEEETKNAKTPQEEHDGFSLAMSMVEEEYNERDYLRQKPWLRRLRNEGVLIPKEYWEERRSWLKPTLTYEGETWVRGEARRLWKLSVEFWFKLVLPVVALIISIVALLRRH